VPVEKIFPDYSLNIASIKFIRRGKGRRAKLYYMRGRIGKAARVKELVLTKEQKEARKASNKKKAADIQAAVTPDIAESSAPTEG